MPTDAELLRRYAEERSETAFAELVRRYVDLVYSAALRQVPGDAHRAQDVAQVVFTTLARKAAALTRHPVLAGWLYTATQHAAAKVVRTEWRRRAREQEAHLMQHIIRADETAIDWERVRPVLDSAMGELNARDREAVLLRYFARRPFGEIGATLGVGEDAARMRVDRALEKLHVLLARRGVTSTSAALGVVLSNHAVIAAPAGFVAHASGSAIAAARAGFDVMIFMSTMKFSTVVAAVIVLFAAGAAVHQVRQQRASAAALTATERTHVEQMAQLRADEERARTAEQALASIRQSLGAAGASAHWGASAMTGGPGATGASLPTDPMVEGAAFLARFPHVKQALLDRSYARIRARFESFYPTLRLKPEQIRNLEEVLLDGSPRWRRSALRNSRHRQRDGRIGQIARGKSSGDSSRRFAREGSSIASDATRLPARTVRDELRPIVEEAAALTGANREAARRAGARVALDGAVQSRDAGSAKVTLPGETQRLGRSREGRKWADRDEIFLDAESPSQKFRLSLKTRDPLLADRFDLLMADSSFSRKGGIRAVVGSHTRARVATAHAVIAVPIRAPGPVSF